MQNLIGISGKIGSGKDTIGKIINFIVAAGHLGDSITYEEYLTSESKYIYKNKEYTIKKYADKLKDIVCLLIGCTREQLEDQKFKNLKLGKEWVNYAYASGFTIDNNGSKSMLSTNCSKQRYEEELRINWQTAYKRELTPRLLLQLLGTECGRNIIHPNIWINALFADYYPKPIKNSTDCVSKWIITDVRFPNEAEAIKSRGGILIRVNRDYEEVLDANDKLMKVKKPAIYHESEIALDNYNKFDVVIDNNGTIEELINKVKKLNLKLN